MSAAHVSTPIGSSLISEKYINGKKSKFVSTFIVDS
jgi:hypothetical protein